MVRENLRDRALRNMGRWSDANGRVEVVLSNLQPRPEVGLIVLGRLVRLRVANEGSPTDEPGILPCTPDQRAVSGSHFFGVLGDPPVDNRAGVEGSADVEQLRIRLQDPRARHAAGIVERGPEAVALIERGLPRAGRRTGCTTRRRRAPRSPAVRPPSP